MNPVPEMARRVGARLVRWLVWGVGFSLVPLAFRALDSFRQFGDATWTDVLLNVSSDGEPLLVGVAISGAALGDLWGVSQGRNWSHLLGGMTTIVLVFSAYWYADFVPSHQQPGTADGVTLTLFGLSAMCSFLCVVTSEVSRLGTRQ